MDSPGNLAIRPAALLPRAPGVYRFRDRAGRVLYVGRAVSLRRRVLSYRGDLGDRGHLAPMVACFEIRDATRLGGCRPPQC